MRAYREVLGLPGVPSTIALMFLARLPATAAGITLTLYVVTGLDRGYGAAGLVGTATMLGNAIGAPLAGRLIDRHGLRPVVATCGLTSTVYYLAAPHLPYEILVLIALPAGMLTVPLGSISRQVLTALVPPPHRRPAYTLDSISVESSFMIGPTVGVAVSTQLSSTAALTGLGVVMAITTVVLCLRNPPIRHPEDGPAGRPSQRTWLTPALAATFIVILGAGFCLMGTEVSVLASLRATGEVAWTGVVITVMCVASVVGGMVHGAVRRSLSQPTLMVLLSVLVIPAGLFPHPWWLLALALVPTNLLCAPTLTATAEQVSKLAPPGVRGQAMGLLDSATRLGIALGSPVVGFAIDHSAPVYGFAVAGAGGLMIALTSFAVRRLAPARARPEVIG